MPVGISSAQPLVDLLQIMELVSRHPTLKTQALPDQFATASSAMNWKPFVIGLLAPDTPLNYVPFTRMPQQIPLAEQPPPVPQRVWKGKDKAKDGEKPSSGVTQQILRTFSMDEFRQALRNSWTKYNGGVSPTEKKLALMLGQACIESGGLTGGPYSGGVGEIRFNEVKSAPNFNFFSYETGMAKNTYEVAEGPPGKYPGVSYRYDSATNSMVKLNAAGEDTNERTALAGMTARRGGKLYYAPESENAGFYKIVNNGARKYIATDKDSSATGAKIELRTFSSFDSLQEATDTFTAYILHDFPNIKKADDAVSWNDAIQHGLEIPNSPYKHKSFHARDDITNRNYIRGLNAGLEAYAKKWGAAARDGARMTGADAENPTDLRVMSWGNTTNIEDALSGIYARNLDVDAVRAAKMMPHLKALQDSISVLNTIPPLVLLVNPQDFRRSHENMVDVAKTRIGNVVHTWFEQPMKINASGASAAQYAVYADMSGGLTGPNRIHSLSYRNLMSLLMTYKNNGMVFQGGVNFLPSAVFIAYDDHIYIGAFDNFGITDDASKPHNLTYSFTFTARYDIHVDVGIDALLAAPLV